MYRLRNTFRAALLTLLVAAAAAAIGACGGESGSSGSGKYNVVLSNYFVSTWRTEMQNLAKTMASENPPYKGQMKMSVVVSASDPTSQIQSLDNIIAQHPSAILIDAGSPTALNPVAQKACAAGIKVIFFDQVGTAPCAYRVHNNEELLFENNAEWLAKTLHYHGNIIQDLGLPGSPISEIATAAAKKVFAKYPGIHVVATYEGDYTTAPSEQAVTRLLTTNKNINGVYGIAGVDGAVEAFLSTNTKLVPMTNFGDISVRMLKLIEQNESKGLQFQLAQNGPDMSGYAVQVAWRLLHNQSPFDPAWGLHQGTNPKDVYIPSVAYNTNGLPMLPGFQQGTSLKQFDPYLSLPLSTQLPLFVPQSPVKAQNVA
jgi:ABC-type sugar transport system substrate-binding protein